MIEYRGVLVGSGELHTALKEGRQQQAAGIFKETTRRYCAMYSAEDRKWFESFSENKHAIQD